MNAAKHPGPPRTRSLVLLGHGSTQNADSSKATRLQAETIRHRALFDEVVAAFWLDEPPMNQALNIVRSDDVFVIPYFISDGYFTEQIIPRELKISGRFTERDGRRIFYGEPVGTHPSMTQALRRSAEHVVSESGSESPPKRETTLIVVGHGTTQNEHSADAILRQVELLKKEDSFADVLPAFTAQEPYDKDALSRVRTPYVIVTPFFISDGLHSREDIPVNMGFAKKGERWKNPVLNPCGKKNPQSLWYANAIGSEPWMTEVILERVRELEGERATA